MEVYVAHLKIYNQKEGRQNRFNLEIDRKRKEKVKQKKGPQNDISEKL